MPAPKSSDSYPMILQETVAQFFAALEFRQEDIPAVEFVFEEEKQANNLRHRFYSYAHALERDAEKWRRNGMLVEAEQAIKLHRTALKTEALVRPREGKWVLILRLRGQGPEEKARLQAMYAQFNRPLVQKTVTEELAEMKPKEEEPNWGALKIEAMYAGHKLTIEEVKAKVESGEWAIKKMVGGRSWTIDWDKIKK